MKHTANNTRTRQITSTVESSIRNSTDNDMVNSTIDRITKAERANKESRKNLILLFIRSWTTSHEKASETSISSPKAIVEMDIR